VAQDPSSTETEQPKKKKKFNPNNYVFDWVHQTYYEGMKTRATYCNAYTKWEFDAWRAQVRAIRALVEDAPALMISVHDLRLRKPKPIWTGVAVCNMSSTTYDPSRNKYIHDQFRRSRGRAMALGRCVQGLNIIEELNGGPFLPPEAAEQHISVVKRGMSEKELRDIYGSSSDPPLDAHACPGCAPEFSVPGQGQPELPSQAWREDIQQLVNAVADERSAGRSG
jgi:hypothetical protein